MCLGIISAFGLTQYALERPNVKSKLLTAAAHSFFLYAIHEPLLTVMRKISYQLFNPLNDMAVLLLYFAIPIVLIVLSFLLYRVLYSISPRLLWVLTGSRQVSQDK